MKCPNCGAARKREDCCCAYCNTPFDQPAEEAGQPVVHVHYHQEAPKSEPQIVYVPREVRSSRSRLVAVLLCLFTGVFGVHKFYLGKIGMGILYIFTYGLFGIGWLVDMIVLLLGHPRDKEGLPLKW